jgi:hypothetical protein
MAVGKVPRDSYIGLPNKVRTNKDIAESFHQYYTARTGKNSTKLIEGGLDYLERHDPFHQIFSPSITSPKRQLPFSSPSQGQETRTHAKEVYGNFVMKNGRKPSLQELNEAIRTQSVGPDYQVVDTNRHDLKALHNELTSRTSVLQGPQTEGKSGFVLYPNKTLRKGKHLNAQDNPFHKEIKLAFQELRKGCKFEDLPVSDYIKASIQHQSKVENNANMLDVANKMTKKSRVLKNDFTPYTPDIMPNVIKSAYQDIDAAFKRVLSAGYPIPRNLDEFTSQTAWRDIRIPLPPA